MKLFYIKKLFYFINLNINLKIHLIIIKIIIK
jgi:hypothetical protein